MRKILILSANPLNTDRLRLDEEVREIQAALERARSREEFELIARGAVRIDDLRRALLDVEPQIIHFSGHGTGTDGMAVEDNSGQVKLVSTESLSSLFGLFKDKTECVLLNACYSETQAEAIYQHIDCVIGMKQSIKDNAAINFSKGFYDAIGAGRNYEDAFKFGCNTIDLNSIPQHLIPAIKIRKNSQTLFASNQTVPKPKEPKNNMSDTFNNELRGSSIGNFANQVKDNAYQQANQYIYQSEEKQTLAQAAEEIQNLLKILEKSNPTATQTEKQAFVTTAITPEKRNKIIRALEAGGEKALQEFLKNPYVNVAMEIVKEWQKAK